MILLGSIQRYELERMLLIQLSQESLVSVEEENPPSPGVPESASPPAPPTTVVTLAPPPMPSLPRFKVTKVDEEGGAEVEDKAQEPQPINASCFLKVVRLSSSSNPSLFLSDFSSVLPRCVVKKVPLKQFASILQMLLLNTVFSCDGCSCFSDIFT